MIDNLKNYNYIYNCGKALYFDLNYNESIRYFHKAIEVLHSQFKTFHLWSGLALEKTNKFYESLIEYLTVINCIPDPITLKQNRSYFKSIVVPTNTTTTNNNLAL